MFVENIWVFGSWKFFQCGDSKRISPTNSCRRVWAQIWCVTSMGKMIFCVKKLLNWNGTTKSSTSMVWNHVYCICVALVHQSPNYWSITIRRRAHVTTMCINICWHSHNAVRTTFHNGTKWIEMKLKLSVCSCCFRCCCFFFKSRHRIIAFVQFRFLYQ